MTDIVITDVEAWVEDLKTRFAPEVKTVENDTHAIVSASITYLQTNGLQDLYALATTVLTGSAAGTAWGTILGTVETQAVAAGKTLVAGAVAVATAQAQADLIAAGTITPPASTPAA